MHVLCLYQKTDRSELYRAVFRCKKILKSRVYSIKKEWSIFQGKVQTFQKQCSFRLPLFVFGLLFCVIIITPKDYKIIRIENIKKPRLKLRGDKFWQSIDKDGNFLYNV